MAQLDTNIPLGIAPVQVVDPLAAYTKAAQIRQLQNSVEAGNLELSTNRTLADLYKNAINPDGTIDRNKVMTGAANAGLGAKIPGLQKQFLEADAAGEELAGKRATVDKTRQEILHAGLKMTDDSIASMLARPDVNENMVMGELGRLVRLGAFNAQAAHLGQTPDDFARNMVSTMPVGNPQALRSWLQQVGMRVMDASKRVELSLPKYDEQDRGGVINQGTVDQMTGVRTDRTNQAKTNTPGELLSAETTQRGQDLTNARALDTNNIAREAAQSQVIETPQGFMVVNKGDANARPVNNAGQPVLTKDSQTAKNAAMARNMEGVIPYARELLKSGPTASGVGARTDAVARVIGLPLDSANVAGQLETLAGWMTSNVPRFEGPQGVQDVIIYQQMAGAIGDRTKSVPERLAALDTVDRLMQKYSGAPGTAPATTIAPRPVVPLRGTPAAPRGSSPMRTPAPAAAPAQPPSIDSFFR